MSKVSISTDLVSGLADFLKKIQSDLVPTKAFLCRNYVQTLEEHLPKGKDRQIFDTVVEGLTEFYPNLPPIKEDIWKYLVYEYEFHRLEGEIDQALYVRLRNKVESICTAVEIEKHKARIIINQFVPPSRRYVQPPREI